ncbi:hypothetical protein OE88DRAFT_633455 [Heliocybe sulcata]|uniref:C2H2-type domain-containing protein n=1 Tax=Heliocybe sulcata TaxID=5364 RepID=A0A5C3NPG4_9AGAM|nr:hypothetical protein OE88DRAFT_633455 [Heliocybe sulcata]
MSAIPSQDKWMNGIDTALGKKTLMCGVDGCTKTFTRTAEVQRHEKNVHLRIRPFRCEWEGCGARFSAKTSLDNHMNTHTGAKPHLCGVDGCLKAFADQSSRSRHRLERHTICELYVCEVAGCGARIKRRTGMNTHRKKKHDLPPLSHKPREDRRDIQYLPSWDAFYAFDSFEAMSPGGDAASSEASSLGTPSPPTYVAPMFPIEDLMLTVPWNDGSIAFDENVDHSETSYCAFNNQAAYTIAAHNSSSKYPVPQPAQDLSMNFMQAQTWGTPCGTSPNYAQDYVPYTPMTPLYSNEIDALLALAYMNTM